MQRLAIIKAKFVDGNPNDLSALFEFLVQHSEDLEESTGLPINRINAIKANIHEITTRELEAVLEFVIDDLPQIRTADKARSILDNVDKMEFYTRELRYSKIELFIFNITRI